MSRFIGLYLGTLLRLLRARRSLLLENLAPRQQLAVLKRRHPRPRLDLFDKLFWVAVRRFWSGWQQSLIAVTPETVVPAQSWIPFVLEADLQSQEAHRETTDIEGSSRIDFPDGC